MPPISATPPRAAVSASRLSESPRGELLVVNANLREAFTQEDVANGKDMRNFVRRLLSQVPHLPDALLLQEVNGLSAERVARLMSNATGKSYVVAARPPDDPFVGGGTKDTAVIVNADSVKVGETGFIKQDMTQKQTRAGEPPKDKYTAWAQLTERRGGMKATAASVHYTVTSNFKNNDKELAWKVKEKWTHQLDDRLDKVTQEGAVKIIAGDFNNPRNIKGREKLERGNETPFWKALDGRGYHDSIFEKAPDEIGTGKRIDYLFTTGTPTAAKSDVTYGKEERADGIEHVDGEKREKLNPKTFYSDHRFNWAVIRG